MLWALSNGTQRQPQMPFEPLKRAFVECPLAGEHPARKRRRAAIAVRAEVVVPGHAPGAGLQIEPDIGAVFAFVEAQKLPGFGIAHHDGSGLGGIGQALSELQLLPHEINAFVFLQQLVEDFLLSFTHKKHIQVRPRNFYALGQLFKPLEVQVRTLGAVVVTDVTP